MVDQSKELTKPELNKGTSRPNDRLVRSLKVDILFITTEFHQLYY